LILLAAAIQPTPPAERSLDAAAMVVRRYYDAVARRDYSSAHRIWSGGRSLAAFRRGYADTAWVKVTPLLPFSSDAGAGSVYATIPVMVNARLRDGTAQHFAGSYTLRRVNDVDGSTAAQRRWRIEGARLYAVR
jgi:hypothetical protein